MVNWEDLDILENNYSHLHLLPNLTVYLEIILWFWKHVLYIKIEKTEKVNCSQAILLPETLTSFLWPHIRQLNFTLFTGSPKYTLFTHPTPTAFNLLSKTVNRNMAVFNLSMVWEFPNNIQDCFSALKYTAFKLNKFSKDKLYV